MCQPVTYYWVIVSLKSFTSDKSRKHSSLSISVLSERDWDNKNYILYSDYKVVRLLSYFSIQEFYQKFRKVLIYEKIVLVSYSWEVKWDIIEYFHYLNDVQMTFTINLKMGYGLGVKTRDSTLHSKEIICKNLHMIKPLNGTWLCCNTEAHR